MADIIIKGVHMPKTCCQCDLKIYDPEKRWDENGIERIGAWVCKRTREIIWNTQRGDNCPLVSLPEKHGRLVDADAVREEIDRLRSGRCYEDAWALTVMDNAPTIIEAEGGENE